MTNEEVLNKVLKSKIIHDGTGYRYSRNILFACMEEIRLQEREEEHLLELNLKFLEGIKYKSRGVGMVFLNYNYQNKYWSVSFRNPVNFNDPNIQEKTPLSAVNSMIKYLNKLK